MAASGPSENQGVQTNVAERALWTVRLIWLMTLLSVAGFAMIIAIDLLPHPAAITLPELVLNLPILLILVMVPVAYIARYLIFKKGREQQAVQPKSFVVGSVVFFVILEAAALFGLVIVFIGGQWLPPIAATILAGFVFLINFPVGKQLYPEPPDSLR